MLWFTTSHEHYAGNWFRPLFNGSRISHVTEHGYSRLPLSYTTEFSISEVPVFLFPYYMQRCGGKAINFIEFKTSNFRFKKVHFNRSSEKWGPLCYRLVMLYQERGLIPRRFPRLWYKNWYQDWSHCVLTKDLVILPRTIAKPMAMVRLTGRCCTFNNNSCSWNN